MLTTGFALQVQLLLNAHEMWESEKYQFVADKVSHLLFCVQGYVSCSSADCLLQIKELGASKEYTPEQCRAQLRLLDTKNSRDLDGASPAAISDPPHSPSMPPMSRKRVRSESLDEDEN